MNTIRATIEKYFTMVKYKDAAWPLCKRCICPFALKDISIPFNMAANKNKAKINCMIFIIWLNLKTFSLKPK